MTDRDWNWNWNDNWDWLRSSKSGDDSQTEFESSESHEQTQAKTDESTHSQTIHRRALLQIGLVALGFTGASSGGVSAATAPENGDTGKHPAVGAETDEVWSQQQKLFANDGDGSDSFGDGVAVSGDSTTVLIGASDDDNLNGEEAGSAYAFIKSGGEWTEQQKLTAPNGDEFGEFGFSASMSIDGKTAFIGAPADGSAHVFSKTGGEWTQQQRLTPPDGEESDDFGIELSVSGDGTTVIISESDGDPQETQPGGVYVFTESGGEWSYQQKLTVPDGEVQDDFGQSLAISGDGTVVFIGSSDDENQNGEQAGSAYVFTNSGGEWIRQQKLLAEDGDSADTFGVSAAISHNGTTALIGASTDGNPNGNDAGAVYVFTETDGEWTQRQKLVAEDGDSEDFFGAGLSISNDGTIALIGGTGADNSSGKDTGAVYVFAETGGEWSHQQKLTAADGTPEDFFAIPVGVSGDGTTAVIGARDDENPSGEDAGSAYVFGRSGNDDGSVSETASLGATVEQTGSPGGRARVSYTITNVNDQTSLRLTLTDIPEELTVNSSASRTDGGSFGSDNRQILFSQPSGEFAPTIAFEIMRSATSGATLTTGVKLLDANSEVIESLTVDVTVADTEPTSVVDEYDTDDNGIGITELGRGGADFASGELSITELGKLGAAFASGS
jgi:hypothetical protein